MQTKLNREPTNASEGVIDNSLLKVDLTKELGRGGFGVVYKAKYRGKDAAVKELLIKDLSPSAEEEFESEAKIMLQLRDPSVVHLYGVTQEKPHRMVLEFCSLGSLDRYLQKRKVDEVSWEVRFHLATGIASGLHYLHTYNPIIIHGDLKSLNVLLTGDSLKPDVKIADFGMSKLKTETLSKSKANASSTDKGFTLQWAAPELFSLKSKKTPASDMYAFGMTLWEIASHEYPYSRCSVDAIRGAVKEGERADVPANTPASFEKIMTDCWSQKPIDRPAAKVTLERLQTYDPTEETKTNESAVLAVSPVGSIGFLESGSQRSESNSSPGGSRFLNSTDINAGSRKSAAVGSRQNTPSTNQATKDKVTSSSSTSTAAITTTTAATTTTTKNTTISTPLPLQNSFSGVFHPSSETLLRQDTLPTTVTTTTTTTTTTANVIRTPVIQAAAHSSAFNQLPKPTTLGYAQQVEAVSKAAQDKINPTELAALLKDVTEGRLVDVENRLKKLPVLALGMGTITDLSDRTFNSITALQYAAWALDKEMCDLIMPYTGDHNSAIQLKALWEASEHYSNYGASYDITPLITKTETYLNNYSQWSDEECSRYWQKEVGGEQRKCPAWLIYAWCEEGVEWWFTDNYNGGRGVGSAWAVVRGVGGLTRWCRASCPKSDYRIHFEQDIESQKSLKQRGMEVLTNLKTTSNKLLGQDMQIPTTVTTTTTTTTTTTANVIQTPVIQVAVHHPSVFNQPPKPTTLGYVQQVEAMAKTVIFGDNIFGIYSDASNKINPMELSGLLNDVMRGHLVNVENRLKKLPVLALAAGTIIDLSGRTFNNITALQYATWALDVEMVELIIKYLGTHYGAVQMKALAESPQIYSSHGASYDMMPLVNKYQMYLDNYSQWNYDKRCQYWQKEIGGEQRKCPAWLIYAWSEEGGDVAWTKKDVNRPIKREYEKHRLEWWFTGNYNNGRGVGSLWAVVRGANMHWDGYVKRHYGGHLLTDYHKHDLECISMLGKSRCERLQQLRTSADSQLSQVSMGLGKRQ